MSEEAVSEVGRKEEEEGGDGAECVWGGGVLGGRWVAASWKI